MSVLRALLNQRLLVAEAKKRGIDKNEDIRKQVKEFERKLLVEKIFNWPGVGSMVVDSFLRKDYAVAQAFFLLSATLFVLVNLIIEILYGVIDPRTRIQGTEES